MTTVVRGINKEWDKQFHWRSGANPPAAVLQEDGSTTRASRVDGDTRCARSVSEVQRTNSEVHREAVAIMQRL